MREKSGTDLTDHYQATLRELGKQSGLLGSIFAGPLSQFRWPVNLMAYRRSLVRNPEYLVGNG